MADFPTIFDWLERLAFLRGLPAAYLALLAALVIVVVWDWRVALMALALHYLAAGLLFVEVLDPRLTIVKVVVGWFVCLILYLGVRQASWAQRLTAVAPAGQEQATRPARRQLSSGALFRIFLGLMVALAALTLSQRPGYQLPAVPPATDLAVYGLLGMGLLGVSQTTEPLKAGMSLLLLMTGFELFYNTVEQSVAMLALLAGAHLVLALVISYLVQVGQAVSSGAKDVAPGDGVPS